MCTDSGVEISVYMCINGLAQDCGNSIANVLQLQQFSTKPFIYQLNIYLLFTYQLLVLYHLSPLIILSDLTLCMHPS